MRPPFTLSIPLFSTAARTRRDPILKTLIGNRFFQLAILYLALLALAETLTSVFEPRAGLALHGLILVGVLLHASLAHQVMERRFLHTLALAPLIRLISLTMPLAHFPANTWYIVIGAPLFAAIFTAVRASKLTAGMLGVLPRRLIGFGKPWLALPLQLLVATSGLLLGMAEYYILRPTPLAATFTWEAIWLPALILLIFTGFLEEFIFRGAMQYTAFGAFGGFGLLYVAAVFAVLHIGYRSLFDVLFVFGVAMYFGWVVNRTGSLLGVTLAHGLTNISLFLIFPFLLAPTSRPVTIPSGATVAPSASSPAVTAPSASDSPSTGAPAADSAPSATEETEEAAPQLSFPPVLIGPPILIEQPIQEPSVWLPFVGHDWGDPLAEPVSLDSMVESTLGPDGTPPATDAGLPVAAPGATLAPEASLVPTTSPTTCGPPAGWVPYSVQYGDSLSILSRLVGTSTGDIRAANCMGSSSTLYAGTVIYLPTSLQRYPTATPWIPWTPTVMIPTATPLPPTSVPTAIPTAVPTQPPPPTQVVAPTAAPTQPPPTDPPPTEPAPTEPVLPTEAPPPVETEPPT